MQHSPITDTLAAFQDDISYLSSSSWLSQKTRALHVSFTMYNPNYDFWVSNRFIIEMTTNGLFKPITHVNLFRVQAFDINHFFIDIARLLLVIYVCTVQIYSGFMFHRKINEAGLPYLRSIQALSDMLIGGLFFYAFGIRFIFFNPLKDSSLDHFNKLSGSFHDDASYASSYNTQVIVEAVLLVFLVFRLLYFLRVNRNIFLIWTSLANALSKGHKFALITLPITFGLILLGQTIHRSEWSQYRTFWPSMTSMILMMCGDLDTNRIYNPLTIWALVFQFLKVVIIKLLFINCWIAILVHMYQKTRVHAGFNPKVYRWKEYNYISWFLFAPLRNFYVTFLRPRIERPKTGFEDDD